MQTSRVPLLLRILIVCSYLSSAFQKSEGKHKKGNNDLATQRHQRHHIYHHVGNHSIKCNKSSVVVKTNATRRSTKNEANKKRYVIEVQDRQQAVKLANPIVDLEDSVQRGINDPLADPRFVMNKINDDFFSHQFSTETSHRSHHAPELMNYQRRAQFSSSALGGNTHLLSPLTASRPLQENAMKEAVVPKHMPMQEMAMPRDVPAMPQQRLSQFPDMRMAFQNRQQLSGLGMQLQMPNQQIQALQRQPIAQLSNIALGGQLTTGIPNFMPRQQMSGIGGIGGIGGISILKQSNSEIPGMNLQRLSPAMIPGQQSNILSSFLPSQVSQQEMAQQQGIALQTTLPAQLRDLTLPQQQTSALSLHSPNPQAVAEEEHNIQGGVRSSDFTESDFTQSDSDKLESVLRAMQRSHARRNPTRLASNSVKAHRKMLVSPHRFINQNQMASQKRANNRESNLKARRVRPRVRPAQQRQLRPQQRQLRPQQRQLRPQQRQLRPQQRQLRPQIKKHQEKELDGFDALTGLPDDLEKNNVDTGVSSITAISDPVAPPSTVTVDTGEDATQIGDVPAKDHSKVQEVKTKAERPHDANAGTRDLDGLDGDAGGSPGGENLSSIKEYLEADNLLRDKLNKDGPEGADVTSEKSNELGESDLSNEKPINVGGGEGENYDGEKPIDIEGKKKRSLL